MLHRLGFPTVWVVSAAIAWLILAHCALASSGDDEIPVYSLALEQRLQPWCPRGCASEVPFAAVYKLGDQTLVFVGVHHVFTPKNSTLDAIDRGFSVASPAIVIAEGFPTAMGESPAPLVKHSSKRGTSEEDQFTKSESFYAISRAIARGIPFVGGEPTRTEQVKALEDRGYTSADLSFAYLLGRLSQSVRSGDLSGPSDPRLEESFTQSSRDLSDQFQMQPLTFDDFSSRYHAMFGVELARDRDFVSRSEPGTASRVALLNQDTMRIRDEHLLATIEEEMASKNRVLVVYGGSHWTTLSRALQARFGRPKITPFLH